MISKTGDEYIQIATDFAQAAKRSRSKNCEFMRSTAGNYLKQLSRAPKGYYMSDVHVARACRFIEFMPIVKGGAPGSTLELAPWQVFHFVNIFGWVNNETNYRKHRTAFCMIAKKNGKSTMAAAVGLYLISPLEKEAGAEVYCGASKMTQAKIVLNVARSMIMSAPKVSSQLNISAAAHHVECTYDGKESRMSALSSDKPQSDDGINASGIILDELHAQANGELRETLRNGTIARKNPLIYEISTAGEHRELSPCLAEYNYAQQWIKGEHNDPSFFPMVFEQDDLTAEISKPKTWYKSNPSLGITHELERLKENYTRASGSPESMATFKQKHLDGFSASGAAWLDMEAWHSSQIKLEAMPKELPLFLGVDLSTIRDLTGLGMVWVDKTADKTVYYIAAESYCTDIAIAKWPQIESFTMSRLITNLGKEINVRYIQDRMIDIKANENVIEVGYDPWQAQRFAEELTDAFEMIEIRQGAKTFSEPMNGFESALGAGRIRIIGDACLTWQAGNLEVRLDANENKAPIKGSAKNKIDAISAILNAFVLAWRYSEDDGWLSADDACPLL